MAVLLLAQGDTVSKDLLRRAIEARYGLRPPALDSLKINFNGRARVKIGPVNAWVPVETTAYFDFPKAMRWDFIAKPLRFPVQRGVEAYDGEIYRTVRGGNPVTLIDEAIQVSAIRKRLWAVASVMLTPLSDLFVKLEATGENSFRAINTQLNDYADVYLRDDGTVDYVTVPCYNPDTETEQDFIIRLSEEQITVDELPIPAKFTMYWDDAESFEIMPVAIEANPSIPELIFHVGDES